MRDLENLRSRSAYPAFRMLCSVLWIVALGASGLTALAGLITMFTASFMMGFGIILSAGLALFLSKVTVEASMMFVDIADCTLDNWRRGLSKAAPPATVTEPEAKVPIEFAERSF